MVTVPLSALGGLEVEEVSPGKFRLVAKLDGTATPVSIPGSVEISNDAGNPIPVAPGLAAATRSYNFAAATRTAVGVASASAALGTLGADREVMLTATTDCYVAFGTSSGVSVAATDTAALRLFAGERFHLRLPAGITHYAVIRDSADGYLRVTPVA